MLLTISDILIILGYDNNTSLTNFDILSNYIIFCFKLSFIQVSFFLYQIAMHIRGIFLVFCLFSLRMIGCLQAASVIYAIVIMLLKITFACCFFELLWI